MSVSEQDFDYSCRILTTVSPRHKDLRKWKQIGYQPKGGQCAKSEPNLHRTRGRT